MFSTHVRIKFILVIRALGRVVAQILNNIVPFLLPNAGTYALVGAAAMLGILK